MSERERYSRLTYAMGEEAVAKMLQSSYLMIGLNAYGVETARNIALSGCSACTLVDDSPISNEDLEVNFFATASDVLGTPPMSRGAVAARGLSELCGSWCSITTSSPEHYLALLGGEEGAEASQLGASVVVCCSTEQWALELLLRLNKRYRHHGVKFVLCEAYGVFMALTNDLGDLFEVVDPLGQGSHFPAVYISSVTLLKRCDNSEEGGEVELAVEIARGDADDDDGLHDSATVVLKQSSVIVSRGVLIHVKTTGVASGQKRSTVATVRVQATRELEQQLQSKYDGGFYLQGLTHPITISYQPLSLAMDTPNISQCMSCDDAEFVMELFRRARRSTTIDQEEESTRCLSDHPAMTPQQQLLAKKFHLARTFPTIAPFATIVGGIVAQEAIKAASGKMMPMDKTFLYDLRDVIPDDMVEEAPAALSSTTEPKTRKNGRTFTQLSGLFGEARVTLLQNASLLVIGAGAIGCEYAKIMSLVGCGFGPRGSITMTDNDSIEQSNLSRQFLFRDGHVGKSKAEVAVAAIRKFDPSVKARALKEKICKETCEVLLDSLVLAADPNTAGDLPFGESFWKKRPILCGAVDNDAARRYLDDLAVRHQLPFVDAGTQGAIGHVVPIVPRETQRLRDLPSGSGGSADKRIPFCTLHYFPSTMNHCVQYATDCFARLFINDPNEVNRILDLFVEQREKCDELLSPAILSVMEEYFVGPSVISTFEDCLRWARRQFDQIFVVGIRRLFVEKPLDHEEDGKRFWEGRIIPRVVTFASDDALHQAFVHAAACLLASVFSVDSSTDENIDREEQSAKTTSVATDESGRKRAALAAAASAMGSRRLHPSEAFDKDRQLQLDFVYAVAAIRASVFSVPSEPIAEVKRIAGKIIPAMLTTTSVVTGLAALAVMKIVMNLTKMPLVDHQVSLADLNQLFHFQSQPPSTTTYLEKRGGEDVLRRRLRDAQEAAGEENSAGASLLETFPLLTQSFSSWDCFSITVKQDISFNALLHAFARKYPGLAIRQMVDLSTSNLLLDLDTDSGTESDAQSATSEQQDGCNKNIGPRVLEFGVLAWCLTLAQGRLKPRQALSTLPTVPSDLAIVLEFAITATVPKEGPNAGQHVVSKQLPTLRYSVDPRRPNK